MVDCDLLFWWIIYYFAVIARKISKRKKGYFIGYLFGKHYKHVLFITLCSAVFWEINLSAICHCMSSFLMIRLKQRWGRATTQKQHPRRQGNKNMQKFYFIQAHLNLDSTHNVHRYIIWMYVCTILFSVFTWRTQTSEKLNTYIKSFMWKCIKTNI